MARLEAQCVTKTRAQHVSRGRAQCVTRVSQSLGHEQLVFGRAIIVCPASGLRFSGGSAFRLCKDSEYGLEQGQGSLCA